MYTTNYNSMQHQRYEGASTAYGPHTLAAYNKKFGQLAKKLAKVSSQHAIVTQK